MAALSQRREMSCIAEYPTKPGSPGKNQGSSNLFTTCRLNPAAIDNFCSYRTPLLGMFISSQLKTNQNQIKGVKYFHSSATCHNIPAKSVNPEPMRMVEFVNFLKQVHFLLEKTPVKHDELEPLVICCPLPFTVRITY